MYKLLSTVLETQFGGSINTNFSQKKEKTSVDKDVETLGPLYTASGNVKVQPLWQTICQFLKKLNVG